MPDDHRKPTWVECADAARNVLEQIPTDADAQDRDAVCREAHTWMALSRLYLDGGN